VQAKVPGGQWGQSTLSPMFEILPPFWETWWFITMVSLAGLAVIALVFFLTIRSYKRKTLLQHQRIIAEHKALISQMNPHFIFNSLNSIQRFFLTNDVESGNDYLVDFGQLIRSILENGRKEWITIEQEEKLLGLYLKLESLRVKNKFDFEIQIIDLKQEEAMIPPMLLQPFVENAIWHGVSQLPHRGKITITIQKSGNCLNAEVRDNGVGRKEKQPIPNGAAANHRSLATKITNERLEFLRLEYPGQVEFEIIDLKDDQGQALGTLVRLSLPYKEIASLNPS
jgi:LytS/YehU family sensor histidine kinase